MAAAARIASWIEARGHSVRLDHRELEEIDLTKLHFGF